MTEARHEDHAAHGIGNGSLNRVAALATLHCLTGCAIGEVLGMVVGTALGWSDAATIALAVFLAFVFGYSLTMLPLLRAGLALGVAIPLAFASDSFSIAVMELVDNGVMLAVPGAMDAPLSNPLFWGALAFALAVAGVVAFPVNRHLIARGQGHAVVHQYHARGPGDGGGAHGKMELEPAGLASSRRLVAIGVAAMAVTIGVATGGAVLVESAHDDEEESTTAGQHGASTSHDADDDAPPRELGGLAVAANGYRLTVEQTDFVAGRPTPFRFTIVGDEGAVREFDEEGGVRMHLIVVRRDLTGYQHLHPTLGSDGSWHTNLTLAAPGVYRAYADFERDGEKTVLGTDLFVAGAFVPAPLPDPAIATEVGGYRVELAAHAEAGEESILTYVIMRDGRPADLAPYLGASGHLVAVREGDLAYLHVHPLEEKRGRIAFGATFPTEGRYRLFLQFKTDDRVHTAPLTVAVGRGHG